MVEDLSNMYNALVRSLRAEKKVILVIWKVLGFKPKTVDLGAYFTESDLQTLLFVNFI